MRAENNQAFKLHLATIIIATIGALILIFIIAVPIVRWATRKTYIDIATAPVSAKLTIDGKEYSNGSHELEPGKYTATLSADGFTSKTFEIEVASRTYTPVINYLLNETEGFKYFERSELDLATLRQITGDDDVTNFLAQYDAKLKIKDELPLIANYNLNEDNPGAGNYIVELTIDDGSENAECEYAFCLLVTGGREHEQYIRDFLTLNNYNYDDYEVIYE